VACALGAAPRLRLQMAFMHNATGSRPRCGGAAGIGTMRLDNNRASRHRWIDNRLGVLNPAVCCRPFRFLVDALNNNSGLVQGPLLTALVGLTVKQSFGGIGCHAMERDNRRSLTHWMGAHSFRRFHLFRDAVGRADGKGTTTTTSSNSGETENGGLQAGPYYYYYVSGRTSTTLL